MKKALNIAIITPFWPPLHGGAERYEHRLAKRLLISGLNVSVFTGTKEREDRHNGDINVIRYAPFGDYTYGDSQNKEKAFKDRVNHLHFIEEALNWVKDNSFDLVILGNALQMFGALFARELFSSIKALNIPVGLFHYDLSGVVEQILLEFYDPQKGWDSVKDNAIKAINALASTSSDLEALHIIRSPLIFRPDFVICDSDWTSYFIDPFGKTPKFVFHPMTSGFSNLDLDDVSSLEMSDVLMINPQKRKNPKAMLALIEENPDLTFRILKGGWGNSFETFLPLVSKTVAYRKGNVDLLEYVENIQDAYKSSRIMFFPSLAEGYGMAAVEPMYFGVPVLSSNYPAIIEGVGDAALTLCPHSSTGIDWTNGLSEIFTNYEYWQKKVSLRVDFLKTREDDEMSKLLVFLEKAAARIPQEPQYY